MDLEAMKNFEEKEGDEGQEDKEDGVLCGARGLLVGIHRKQQGDAEGGVFKVVLLDLFVAPLLWIIATEVQHLPLGAEALRPHLALVRQIGPDETGIVPIRMHRHLSLLAEG